MNKYSLSPLILIVVAIMTFVLPTYADDASQSGSIQDKLKALEAEIASRASQLKLAVDKKLENKMFAGTVIAKTDSQLTISPEYPDPDNPQNEVVLVNSFTDYSTSSKKLSQTVGNGDFIIALGDVDDKGNLAAKKVIKSTPPDDPTFQSASGKVVSIDGLTITVDGKDKPEKITTSWNTNFYSGSDEIALSNIKTDRFVVAIGEKTDDDIKARFVYLMPEEQIPTPKPSASSSASPKK